VDTLLRSPRLSIALLAPLAGLVVAAFALPVQAQTDAPRLLTGLTAEVGPAGGIDLRLPTVLDLRARLRRTAQL